MTSCAASLLDTSIFLVTYRLVLYRLLLINEKNTYDLALTIFYGYTE